MAATRLSRRQRRGRRAERLVARAYIHRGYELIERNYCCRRGEIDLIVKKTNTIVFVEVRSAATGGPAPPAQTVGPVKQSRVIAAAQTWMAGRGVARHHLRFDVAGVIFSPWKRPSIDILENAFTVTEQR
ncbi:MAG: YraN family protein [Myxococcota bacterium]|nr:YraN family protein [Myxococcota bacterium]